MISAEVLALTHEEIANATADFERLSFDSDHIQHIVKHYPQVLLTPQDYNHGIRALERVLIEKHGLDIERFRILVLRYPIILQQNDENLDLLFDALQEVGVSNEETLFYLLECPRLGLVDIRYKMREVFLLMDLYYEFSKEEVVEIFRKFPYLFCVNIYKLEKFLGLFKRYTYTKSELFDMLRVTGPILAFKTSALTGLFNFCRGLLKMKAKELKELMKRYCA